MKSASECRTYAAQCRALAERKGEIHHQQILLSMAEIWEGLAREAESHHRDEALEVKHVQQEP